MQRGRFRKDQHVDILFRYPASTKGICSSSESFMPASSVPWAVYPVQPMLNKLGWILFSSDASRPGQVISSVRSCNYCRFIDRTAVYCSALRLARTAKTDGRLELSLVGGCRARAVLASGAFSRFLRRSMEKLPSACWVPSRGQSAVCNPKADTYAKAFDSVAETLAQGPCTSTACCGIPRVAFMPAFV